MKISFLIVLASVGIGFLGAESFVLKLDDYKWSVITHSPKEGEKLNGTVSKPVFSQDEKGSYFSSNVISTEKPNFFFSYACKFAGHKLPELFKVRFRFRFTTTSGTPSLGIKVRPGLLCQNEEGVKFELVVKSTPVEYENWNDLEIPSSLLKKRILDKNSVDSNSPFSVIGLSLYVETNGVEGPMDLKVDFSDVEISSSESQP